MTGRDHRPPAGQEPGTQLNLCLLLCLLVACPPAGIAYAIYWIMAARREPKLFLPGQYLGDLRVALPSGGDLPGGQGPRTTTCRNVHP